MTVCLQYLNRMATRTWIFARYLNPASLVVVQGWVESCVKDAAPETRYQFERWVIL
jgi:hypothetical protein